MSEEQGQTISSFRRIMTVIALFMFLVGLPMGSYIYLKKGYDYQKAAMKDMRKEHRLSFPPALTQLGGATEIVAEDNFHLIGLLPQGTISSTYGEVLRGLHEQFDQPKNLLLWSVFEGGDSTTIEQFHTAVGLPQDTSQLLYWSAGPTAFTAFVNDLGLLPEEIDQLQDGIILLVDDSLYVRRAFAYKEDTALKQLVERTAMLLPERSKPKPELRRNPEL